YELVTGKHAFDGDSQFAILGAHLEQTPVPPITLDPKVPQALNDLIMISVTREPDRRFQTAEAFRNALKSVSEATFVMDSPHVRPVTRVADPPPIAASVPGAPPPQKSHRALWATVGALCFVAVLVGAIQFGPWKKAAADSPPPQATPAPQQQLVIKEAPVPSSPAAEVPPASTASIPSPTPAQAIIKPQRQSTQASPVPAAPMQQAPIQQAPIQQQPAAPQPDVAAQQSHRAELQKVRESVVLASARVNSIHSALDGIRRSQAASGLGMRSDWQQAASLMDSFLQGANDALAAGDAAAAKDFLEKSERQLEKLEKALNK
ncbi:MAG: serine/threonine protein kinase, partial [Candidatus Solibacter sp.]|nr:serine/threonine protein kinase [Candidatus Solibacter sp.]